MKKFKRFLCIPLLVLFTMSMLTLPVAAAVTVLLRDGNPAASMTFTFNCDKSTIHVLGPVEVTSNAQGIVAYPAGLFQAMDNSRVTTCDISLKTTSPSKMEGEKSVSNKRVRDDVPIIIKLSPQE